MSYSQAGFTVRFRFIASSLATSPLLAKSSCSFHAMNSSQCLLSITLLLLVTCMFIQLMIQSETNREQGHKYFFFLPIIKMEIRKLLVLDQNSQKMEDLANKNGTTYGICGFVACAVVEYLASIELFTPEVTKSINAKSMEEPIDRVMKAILARRRFELKKFYKIMNDNDRKKYLKNWVANYEIADYLQGKSQQFKNKQVYFFRQSAFDHPELMKDVELQEKERIGEQEPFKGHRFFYSSFNPYANHFKENFEEVLRNADQSKTIIIATDILGHFYTTVLFQGKIYILDTLSAYMDTRHDSQIVECIEFLYKQSYLIKEKL